MDPIRHLALDLLSPDQCREMIPGTTVKALAVSISEDSSGIETATSAKEQLNPLRKRANKVVQEAGLERSRENVWRQSIEQRRVEHHEKKQKLRRSQLVREADKIQDREPMHISPFNALPHFKYMDIAESIETDVPPELFGFGSLGLSATGTFKDSEQTHLHCFPLEGIDHSKTPSDKENTYQQYVPQDNLLCIFKTCPIQEMHCEGPYHHNSK